MTKTGLQAMRGVINGEKHRIAGPDPGGRQAVEVKVLDSEQVPTGGLWVRYTAYSADLFNASISVWVS